MTKEKARTGGRRQTDVQEFSLLFEQSLSQVVSFLYVRTLDMQMAEDVAADAFLRAWRSFSKYDPSVSKFSTWVIAIARNVLSDRYRQDKPTVDLAELPEGLYAVNDSYPSVDEYSERVTKALSVLSESERELIHLKYWECMRNSEIAKITGTHVSTVGSRLLRAREKLRPELEDL